MFVIFQVVQNFGLLKNCFSSLSLCFQRISLRTTSSLLCSVDNTKVNAIFQRVILKYETTHKHPQPPTTICNRLQQSTTPYNHPEPPTVIRKYLQTPKKPPATIHSHPQSPTTTQKTPHNHPKVTLKSQNLSQTVMLLHFRC